MLEEIVYRNIEKIERKVEKFKKDSSIHLSVHIEKNPHREQFFCWATLYMPMKVLTSRADSFEINSALAKIFSALSKQLDKVKYKVEKHLLKKQRVSAKDTIVIDE